MRWWYVVRMGCACFVDAIRIISVCWAASATICTWRPNNCALRKHWAVVHFRSISRGRFDGKLHRNGKEREEHQKQARNRKQISLVQLNPNGRLLCLNNILINGQYTSVIMTNHSPKEPIFKLRWTLLDISTSIPDHAPFNKRGSGQMPSFPFIVQICKAIDSNSSVTFD